MGTVEKSGSVHAPAAQLFDFLADVRNLPRYFARMTAAEPLEGGVRVEAVVPDGSRQSGEAWFRVDDATRRIAWGSHDGAKDYSGELEVFGDESTATVTIRLHTEHEGGDTEQDLETSLANIRRLVESAPDAPDPAS